MINLPTFGERLQLALASVKIGDLNGYTVLSDLIAEASAGA